MELRCDAKLHGVLVDGKLEVRCKSRFCGHKAGIVVIHQFNLHTGEVETVKFTDPSTIRERNTNGART